MSREANKDLAVFIDLMGYKYTVEEIQRALQKAVESWGELER